MSVTTGVINPTSTVSLPSVAGRCSGANSNDLLFSVAASGTASWSMEPEAFPCVFSVIAGNGTNVVYGTIQAFTTGALAVSGGSALVTASPSANQLQATISSGTITLTAHSTFTTTNVRVVRIA